MEAILGFQEVDEIVKKGLQEPLKGDSEEVKRLYKENIRLDCKARMLLHQCISASIFQKVSKATTAKEVWDILQDGYGNSCKVKKVRLESLQRQYELLCMGEQEKVVEYIGRIQIVVNAMRACDKRLTERKNAEKGVTQGTNQACRPGIIKVSKVVGEAERGHVVDAMAVEARNPLIKSMKTMEVSRRRETIEEANNLEAEEEKGMTKEVFNATPVTNSGTTLQSADTMKL
ncbi:uncharacterized protein LOC108336599 [Vigna angularis]|uniref:uncharacterized protein LOC108336599 n=1 Tax=Phaseolus angularis TaxID=3914 RepID=UPI0008099C6E|nr:uncharacterized protein LOC108336599 [Vigna angularis]